MNIDITLSQDENLQSLREYQIIKKHLQNYDAQSLLRMAGNCIAACDIITILLHQDGIESAIIECQTIVKFFDGKKENYNFIGFDGIASVNNIDTHVVVVTKSKRPILIDISLSHLLPYDHPFIVELVQEKNDLLGDYTIGNHTLTYQLKKTIKLPLLHQKTILEKMKNDIGINSKIKYLGYFVSVVLTISVMNLILNVSLLYLN
jgi:hypothetical protein